ncbi:hypothetical protein [Sphingomonas sp.]|uniref:hypothetical protein n=1 Tax=Sphingomonas sp. TaxID=28214 RepID=UPI0035A88810
MAVLIEVDALSVGAGSRVTLRFAGSDDARITSLNGVVWWPGIITAPVLSMEGWDGNFTSAAILASASFTIDPVALRRNDSASPAYRWPGAAVRIYEGAAGASWGSWVQRFAGLIEDYSVDEAGRFSFQAKVDGEPFENPVLVNSYAGTGGAEGGDDLKSKPKPAVFGRAKNIEPVLINSVDNVYQVHGYGAISAVSNVYERAADLVENGGTNVGNFASYAALVAASIPEGSFGTCLAQGMFRLGAPPAGLITCDVDGDTVSGFVRTTADIIARICAIASVPGGRTDSGNLSALNTAVPQTINLYLTQQIKVIDIVQALARPCNAQALISWTGVLRIVRFGVIPTPAMTLDADGRALPPVLAIQESKTSPPYWRIEMRGNRCWRVQSADEIALNDLLQTFRQASVPTGAREGDLWIDTDDGNLTMRHGGLGLFLDGVELVLGGARLDIPWVAARDQKVLEAEAALALIASDGILSRGEKPEVNRQVAAINAEYAGIIAQAASLGITTERTAYIAAYDALLAYLASLASYADTSLDTPIVAATFQSSFVGYYSARTVLLTKSDEVAATKAVWSGVTGTGGQPSGADVAGTVKSGGGVANNNVSTPAIVANGVTGFTLTSAANPTQSSGFSGAVLSYTLSKPADTYLVRVTVTGTMRILGTFGSPITNAQVYGRVNNGGTVFGRHDVNENVSGTTIFRQFNFTSSYAAASLTDGQAIDILATLNASGGNYDVQFLHTQITVEFFKR